MTKILTKNLLRISQINFREFLLFLNEKKMINFTFIFLVMVMKLKNFLVKIPKSIKKMNISIQQGKELYLELENSILVFLKYRNDSLLF